MSSKVIKIQQAGCYLREEELLAWKKRQETIRNLITRLNHQIEDFRSQKNTIEKLKKHETQLMQQSLDEYKRSTLKLEEFWRH